jgi:hypothetical protein
MTIKPQPKIKPKRNPKYLSYIRKQGCIFCGQAASAHHCRRHRFGAGVSVKPHDYCTLALCEINGHHDAKSEKLIDVENHIIRNMVGYVKLYCDKLDFIDALIDFIESQR